MLDVIKVIILGIVEGITEWLPISSTGHMILVEQFLRLNVSEEYWNMFLVVIQLGAILAVVFLYFPRLWPFTKTNPKETGIFRVMDRKKFVMWIKILISCVPAIVIGLPFDDWLDEHLYNYPTVALMLIIYGVLFLLIEKRNKKVKPIIRSIDQIDYVTALLIGMFQVLALIPGTSRSGATILGGIILGMSRKTASEYTFLPGDTGHAGSKLAETGKIRFDFLRIRIVPSDRGYAGSILCIDLCNQVPSEIYQKS